MGTSRWGAAVSAVGVVLLIAACGSDEVTPTPRQPEGSACDNVSPNDHGRLCADDLICFGSRCVLPNTAYRECGPDTIYDCTCHRIRAVDIASNNSKDTFLAGCVAPAGSRLTCCRDPNATDTRDCECDYEAWSCKQSPITPSACSCFMRSANDRKTTKSVSCPLPSGSKECCRKESECSCGEGPCTPPAVAVTECNTPATNPRRVCALNHIVVDQCGGRGEPSTE